MAFVLRTYKIAFVDIHYNDIYIYIYTHTPLDLIVFLNKYLHIQYR
jgi:hypothetical protein